METLERTNARQRVENELRALRALLSSDVLQRVENEMRALLFSDVLQHVENEMRAIVHRSQRAAEEEEVTVRRDVQPPMILYDPEFDKEFDWSAHPEMVGCGKALNSCKHPKKFRGWRYFHR